VKQIYGSAVPAGACSWSLGSEWYDHQHPGEMSPVWVGMDVYGHETRPH
jgi:hypothetical protein